jgi:hypothetical protein
MAKSDEEERDRVYEWLTKEFRETAEALDIEGKAYLDGKLWALSQRMAQAGITVIP